MSEHNWTGYRRCDTEDGCGGFGFRRIGSIGSGNCEYVRCKVCNGAGQTYIEVAPVNRPPPSDPAGAGPSIFAQRQQNAQADAAAAWGDDAINLDLLECS